jgi:electron transport complex protein RnfG
MATPAEPIRAWGKGKAAAVIVLTAAVLAAVLTWAATATADRIRHNEQAWLQQRLDALIAPSAHDNDLLTDRITVTSPEMLGIESPVPIFRARLRGQPVAAVIYTTAPDGYQGPIEMLVAIALDGKLIGVQIVRHRETQGLGDQFENRRVDWLRNFTGRSLNDPPQQRWSVRKDGGDFDEFTGATITPRAIVRATRRALEFYDSQRDRIFKAPAER